MILTVDLASKFSAWMVTDDAGKVYQQGDSSSKTPLEVAELIAFSARLFDVSLVLIEDVPYGIRGQFQTKPVLRLQGIIIKSLHEHDPSLLDKTYWINPSTWQNKFPGVGRGKPEDRIAAAAEAAKVLGYEPPNLVSEYIADLPEGKKPLKKYTNPLAKTMTDYVDAFLMSAWVRATEDIHVSGVQPTMI